MCGLSRKPSALGELFYAEADIHALADRVIVLPSDGLLAVEIDEGEIAFAVFARVHGPTTDGTIGAFHDVVFHGEGYAGLRECRHTWWGEDGYLYYPDPELISAAFVELRQWFDF